MEDVSMIKLIVGVKGSGKTKTLIEMANTAVDNSNGDVICIEKGTKLIHEIKYQARLIDTDEYKIGSADELYGFIAGVYASNRDVTDIFIDSALKICNCELDVFEAFMSRIAEFAEKHGVNFVITSSIPIHDLTPGLAKYL
jgi:hypothetical protein